MPAQELEEEAYEAFATSFTACAVYFVYCGHELEDLEWKDGTCTFFFEDTQQLQDHLKKYIAGKARVEPRHYSTIFGQVSKRMRTERDRLEGHTDWNKK